MRLCLMLGTALALAACSSSPAPRLPAEAPINPLVAEEEASVAASDNQSAQQHGDAAKGTRSRTSTTQR